jgi:phage terminase large subunit-like protein
MTPQQRNRYVDALVRLPEKVRLAKLRVFTPEERHEFRQHWRVWARRQQLPPEGDWRTWLIMAGRGFGKTRAGSEWIRTIADADPEARIAIVAASLGEARAVMVEGESGIMATGSPHHMPFFEPSLRRISWSNGAQATLYSAGEPEALRGPQHTHASRAGAERILRQRSPRADRRPAPLRSGRRGERRADRTG